MISRRHATLFVLALVAGCASAPRAAETAEVRFEIVPENARIYTDERFVGSARVLATRPATFRTGPRRISISADGYFPHDLELELPAGLTTVRVSLRPVPR